MNVYGSHATANEAYECETLHEPCPEHRPFWDNAFGHLRVVRRDGEPQWMLQCPDCEQWADLDDDQFHGRVSVDHTDTGCSYHETHDFSQP